MTSLEAFEEASQKEITVADYLQPIVTYKVVDSIAIIHIGKFDVQGAMGDSGTYGEFLRALKTTEYATMIQMARPTT